MNYFPLFLVQSGQTDGQTDGRTDGQTESDAYEPTVQFEQVGSKKKKKKKKNIRTIHRGVRIKNGMAHFQLGL